MAERIADKLFHDSDGVDDWRVAFGGATARLRAESFAAGAAFVDVSGALTDSGDERHVDVRPDGVTVRLEDMGGLTERHLEPTRQSSAVARGRGLSADPAAVQRAQVPIDAHVGPDVMPFWRPVLGYRQSGDEDLIDPNMRRPAVWFPEMRERRRGRSPVHVDVWVRHDRAEARIAAGGRLVSESHAPSWWTLADAERNEVDVASWAGRE